jgi:spermidine synthase
LAALLVAAGQAPDVEALSVNRLRLQLFATSFAMLFLELIFIRWISAYVRYLGFFTNFILLASFLGIGAGILAGRRKQLWLPPFPALLLVLVLVVAYNRFEFHLPSTQVLYYGAGEQAAQAENWVVLPLIFTLVALNFVPLARPLGRLLNARPPLEAYALDILGSLAGTAAFFIMSYLSLPPTVWFVVLALISVPLLGPAANAISLPLLIGTIYIVYQLSLGSLWSPYYRVQYYPTETGGYMINVNNIAHQSADPYQFKEGMYFRAYDLAGGTPYARVLVLGAGSGSDVAIALHNGAQHVDAVEIDPVIYGLGQMLNPDQPYADPRVQVHVNDGRAFLRNTTERYDLIVFALPDSLVLTSGFASVRLESFLLTTDALRAAKEHLADGGAVVMYNYYREDWQVRKLATMMVAVFGAPPFVETYGVEGRAAVLIDGPRLQALPAALDIPYREPGVDAEAPRGLKLPIIGQGRMSSDTAQMPATDDWPFVYMPAPTVPTVYLNALGGILLIALALLWLAAPRGTLVNFDGHFFFLGAAFMLLEARSLVTFALLFGNTWMVNSLVFFAILASVLLAILFNARLKIRTVWPLYVLLLAALLLNYVLPLPVLLGIEPPLLRYSLASVLAFAPIFLANVIFSRSFRDTHAADMAFAWNLLGIMIGGMLEYAALAIGYQALLLLVIGLYTLAFVFWQRLRAAGEPAAGGAPPAAP